MSPYTLGLVSLLYLLTGVDCLLKGQWAWGGFWACYAIANTLYLIATRSG